MLKELFAGKAFSSIENIATEWIQTNKEKAEAQAVMVKALDPNGRMRLDQSRLVGRLYATYLLVMLTLITLEFFGFGSQYAINAATDKIVQTFTPVTALYGVIVTASFGVNAMNVKQGK